jgi:heterodisulfide reductase subunit C
MSFVVKEWFLAMSQEILYPDYEFIREVEKGGPFQAEACFQCRKCTSGCPVTFAMDLYPDEVIRLVILGQREMVLSCKTIWVCAGCETCTTRCPNEVKIAELMDCLKEMAIEEKVPGPVPQVRILHQTFLNNVRRHGRMFESMLLPVYRLRSRDLGRKLKDGSLETEVKLGWKMFQRGRMPLWPKRSKAKKELGQLIPSTKSKSGES